MMMMACFCSLTFPSFLFLPISSDLPDVDHATEPKDSCVSFFDGGLKLHCESKKLCHFCFYCNFGKIWPIFKIISLLESEIMST